MSVRVLSPHNCANKWPQVASGHYPKIIVRALLADNVLTTNNSCDNVLSESQSDSMSDIMSDVRFNDLMIK